jgi:general secretion pathway protein G
MKTLHVRFTISVISVVVLLVSISCQTTKLEKPNTSLLWRESILRDNLGQFRRMIDQYAADKQALPQTLEDLVRSKYLREVPEDPITGNRDWQIVTGEDPSLINGPKGIVDVRSSSSAKSSEKRPYNEW